MKREPLRPGRIATTSAHVPVAARHYVAGHDNFEEVLSELMQQFSGHPRWSHERALAMFEVIEWCTINGRELPWDIGHTLLMAFDKFMAPGKHYPTLDAALGLRRPGKAARAARNSDRPSGLSEAAEIVRLVTDLHAAGWALDASLFEEVGRRLKAAPGKSTVAATYYARRDDYHVQLEIRAGRVRDAKREAAERAGAEAARELRARRKLPRAG